MSKSNYQIKAKMNIQMVSKYGVEFMDFWVYKDFDKCIDCCIIVDLKKLKPIK